VFVCDFSLAGHLVAAFIRCRRLQISGIGNPGHLGSKDARLSQSVNGAIEPHLQVPQVQLHQMLGQSFRAKEPLGVRALPFGCD
jgi:hypothetical protein